MAAPPRLARLALAAASLALLAHVSGPAPLPAQPLGFEVSGQAGALVPSNELVGGTGDLTSPRELDRTAVFGGNVSLHFSSGFGLEVQGVRAADADFADGTGAQADFSAVTGALVYRVSLPLVGRLVEPFFGVGGGYRDLSFEDAAELEPAEGSDPVGVALVGTYVDLPVVPRLRLEARDYLSEFSAGGESRLQNDFAFLGGVALRLP